MFLRAEGRLANVEWPQVLTLPHSLLDCPDEVIEFQKTVAMHGLSILARPRAVWVLRDTTEWLRLPLQPTKSSSGALLTFAHRPNFKRVS
jgi:hypothetical protein